MPDGFKKLENPPVEITGLNDGVYALTLDSPGYSAVKTTFSIAPGKCTRLRIRLIRHDQTPEGFVHIPAGTFLMGPRRMLSRMPTEQALPDFLIQRYPVTAQEYLDFLRSLYTTDPETARQTPAPAIINAALPVGEHLLTSGNIENQQGWDPEIPVVGISAGDAIAYSRWYGDRIGCRLRLPSEEEWEKLLVEAREDFSHGATIGTRPCALAQKVGPTNCRQRLLTLNMTAQLAWYMA